MQKLYGNIKINFLAFQNCKIIFFYWAKKVNMRKMDIVITCEFGCSLQQRHQITQNKRSGNYGMSMICRTCMHGTAHHSCIMHETAHHLIVHHAFTGLNAAIKKLKKSYKSYISAKEAIKVLKSYKNYRSAKKAIKSLMTREFCR